MSKIEKKSTSLFSRVISQLFGVQEQSVSRISYMFLYSLLAVGSFILGRIVRDILLLSLPHKDVKEALPVVIGISAITVSFVSFWYSRYAHRLRRDRMIMLINFFLTLGMMILYLALLQSPQNVFLLKSNYVFVEVMGSLQVIQFWTLASELFDSREAKKSFAIIGGGAVLANLLAFAIRPLVKAFSGAIHLLPLLSGMLLACIGVVFLLGRQNRDVLDQILSKKKQPSGKNSSESANNSSLWSNKHLLIVAGIIVVTFLTTTIIDFQFKTAASQHFAGQGKEALANYFGLFYGITGIIACLIQFGFANRILERAGIRFALLLLPVALLGGSFSLLVAPMAWLFFASTFAKGSENVLRYTINDVSLNLLYVPVAADLRARAKPFIDGILKPGSIGLSAGLIALLSNWGMKVHHLSWISLLLLCVWVYLIFRAHQEYIRTLMDSMGSRGLDLEASAFSLKDDVAIRALRSILQSNETNEIRHALELLVHIPDAYVTFEKELVHLLRYPDSLIKKQTLRLLSSSNNQSLQKEVQPLLLSEDAEIRGQSIETLCSIMTDEAIEVVVSHLKDSSLTVRTSTIVGLIQHGGIDGILHAASDLKELLDNKNPELRKVGAQVLGRLAIRNYYQPVLRLLNDSDVKVQIEALLASGSLKSSKLLPILFQKSSERETAQYATRALIQYGKEIQEEVFQTFRNSSNPIQLMYLARVLTQIGGQDSFALLQTRLFETKERAVRHRLLYAMQRILSHSPSIRYDEAPFLELLQTEFTQYYRWVLDLETIQKKLTHPSSFREALLELMETALQQIFEILALLYPPPRQIRMISFQIEDGSPRLRANAIELLDNLLSSEIARPLLPILEKSSQLSSIAKDFFEQEPEDLDTVLKRLFENAPASLSSLLLWSIGENKLENHQEFVKEQLISSEAIIRETCLLSLGELLAPTEFKEILAKYLQDPAPTVANYAQHRYNALSSVT